MWEQSEVNEHGWTNGCNHPQIEKNTIGGGGKNNGVGRYTQARMSLKDTAI
jgi:hypothetical protein